MWATGLKEIALGGGTLILRAKYVPNACGVHKLFPTSVLLEKFGTFYKSLTHSTFTNCRVKHGCIADYPMTLFPSGL